MNFGNLLGGISNFLGSIFSPQKKKDTPVQSHPQAPTQASSQLQLPQQSASPQMPAALTLHFQPPTTTPQLGGVQTPKPAQASPVQPKSFVGQFGNAVGSLGSNVGNFVTHPVEDINHIGDAVSNFVTHPVEDVRNIGGGIVDTANLLTRVPETIQLAGNQLTGNTDQARLQEAGYGAIQKKLQDLSNFISGNSQANANRDTTEEAKAISSGQANPGQILDAAVKSLSAATVAPVSRLLGAATKAEAPLILGGVEEKAATGEIAPPVKPTVIEPKPTEPNSPVVSVNETGANKAPAITSNNQPVAPTPVETPVVKPIQVPAVSPPIADLGGVRPIDGNVSEQIPTGELGSITRNAIHDGSINTQEGVAKAISDTRVAANTAADSAGDSLPDIIRKGQDIWEASQNVGHDLTPKEVVEGYKPDDLKSGFKGDPSFTPAQQKVYQDYAQEIKTLRDRSGLSVEGGDQGKWYAPQQKLIDDGAGKLSSQEFDPALVNEGKRNSRIPSNLLDTSEVPFEHAMQRYADAPNIASQKLVGAVEQDAKTGEATGIKVPDNAKAKLESSMNKVVAKRDEASKLAHEGNTDQANKLGQSVQDDINSMFNTFIDDIPGSGKARRAAINSVKAERDVYLQTTAETLSLSNVVNRAADQGTKAVLGAQKPLVRGLEKVISPLMEKRAMAGADVNALNTTKEARVAARQVAKGELGRQVSNNFKASMAQAGAGRNPLMKGLAKIDALPRALNSSATQLGDLATSNVEKALQLGASRPEAQGLKTVEDYRKYFGDYKQTSNFRDDLNKVEADRNARIGLAGSKGDNMSSGGKVSGFLSRNVDNGIKTFAKSKGVDNRLVNEANDYVKSNVTGFTGVSTRVAGSIANAAALGIPKVVKAVKLAKSGDPTAVAQATQMAAQSVADGIAAYGTAGAAATLLANSGGVIGFTGAQPEQGSSAAGYNKDNSIPADQWYVNIGDNRVYLDPARPFGAPGVAANIVGGIAKSKNPASGLTDSLSQIYNQTGGSSLPDTIVNAKTAFADSSASPSSKQYANRKVQSTLAPSTGLLNNIANFLDPTKRAPTNFVEDLKSNLPVLRASTPVAKDSAGNPLPNSKQATGGSYLASTGKNTTSSKTDDPVKAEIDRLHAAGIDVTPTAANTNAKNSNVPRLSKALLTDKLYTSADDKTKASMLKGVVDGTSVKDINSSLSPADQQALLDSKLLGNKQKAWLDNNKNNAAYQTAVYNNSKANDTLTDTDKDVTNPKGLLYKATEAQVNNRVNATYELKNTYGNTSQSELKALLNPKSDTYDLEAAQKLYDYDQARVAAGLPPKYNLAKAEKASGGVARSGGSGSKSFAFANLPSSLTGTGSTSAGYASNAPLFTPIASLQAPQGAAIPRGRTISAVKVK